MQKYIVLFMSVFMLSACCTTAPVRQVDVYGADVNYQVRIKAYPSYHIHHRPVIVRPAPRPHHIVHTPPFVRPHHHSGWRG